MPVLFGDAHPFGGRFARLRRDDEQHLIVFDEAAVLGKDAAHHAVDTAYLRRRDEETTTSVTDLTVRLTKAEAEQLTAELQEVLRRWTGRTRGGSPGRRSYLLTQILQPHPETLTEPDGDPGE